MSVDQIIAITVFIAVFVIAGLRKLHVGIIALVAAFGVGTFVAGMTPNEVVDGFPVSLMLLLAGVTLFFGVAQVNGTVDALIDRTITRSADKTYLVPLMFFLLSAGVAAMASTAALAIVPIGMEVARRYRIDPMLIAVSLGTGLTVGMFAPTGLFGIITYGTALEADIALSPLVLFAVAVVINVVLLIVGYVMFGGVRLLLERNRETERVEQKVPVLAGGGPPNEPPLEDRGKSSHGTDAPENTDSPTPFNKMQKLTIVTISVFVITVIGLEIAGIRPDIGLLSFSFAAILMLIDPSVTKSALTKIDWSTVLLVGGIITFVSVLQSLGVIETLGDVAASIGVPFLSAFVLFIVAGLISAFASTTGTLAAIVPLAIPLAATGELSGWAVIVALALCSALADVAPFSTVGATMVATAPEWPGRPLHTRLFAWGMSMVVVGPLLLLMLLVIPTSL